MMCLGAPAQVAVVDRIESPWAEVELDLDRFVTVEITRLPVGAKEGELVCYCWRPTGVKPLGFQSCPSGTELNFNQERRSRWRL
jgi:transcription elongation factor